MRRLTASPISIGLGMTSAIAAILSTGIALQDARLWRQNADMRDADRQAHSAPLSVSSNAPNAPALADAPIASWNLSRGDDLDAPFRSAGLLAKEQAVIITHMQRKAISTSSHALGRVQYGLQLRGHYAAIKLILIGLLQKFPGLLVERLTINSERHGAPGAQASDDVDASLELVQLLSPPSDL